MHFTPKELVEYLDLVIVGQAAAKNAIAVALRNRYRLTRIKDLALKERFKTRNILFLGPTGVGKTEIVKSSCGAGSSAILSVASSDNSNKVETGSESNGYSTESKNNLLGYEATPLPFVKVDATRFTEIGYVGPDVETVIHELVEKSIAIQKEIRRKDVVSEERKEEIYKIIATAILNKLNIPPTKEEIDKCVSEFKEGKYDNTVIEIQVAEKDIAQDFNGYGNLGIDVLHNPSSHNVAATVVGLPFGDFLKAFSGHKDKVRRLAAKKAFEILLENEQANEDKEGIISIAMKEAQEKGVVFIDEMDKLINNKNAPSRGDVSREGVQRDLLPLVDGTVVQTKYGPFDTKHVLFIAAGAFHSNKPTDLLNELQGRFPIKVKLDSLSTDDFIKILNLPKYSIIKQTQALMEVDNIKITFTDSAIRKMAECATKLNSLLENTGVRRLYGVVEAVVEEVSFQVSKHEETEVVIDAEYVENKMKKLLSEDGNRKENYVI